MPAPSLCVVSGVVYDENGAPAVNVTLYLTKVLLNGVLIGTAPIGSASIPGPSDHNVFYIEAITSDAVGAVSFTVPQLSTVYLEGNVSGYNNGEVALSIPATATSTLEALTPATFPIDVTTFTFLSLVDTPDDFTGDALKVVRVNAAGTALEFATAGAGYTDAEADARIALAIGVSVQAFDADLVTLASSISAFGLSLVDDANAAAGRTTLELSSAHSPTFAGLTLTGPLLAADGGLSTPSHSFTSAPTVGLRMRGAGSTAMDFVTGGVNRVEFAPTYLRVSSTSDIGWSSTTDAQVSADTGLVRQGVNIVRVTNGSTGGGALQLTEMTSPAAPATNNIVLFAEDNGSGKTRLMARFPTGATQQVAIEP